MHHISNSVETPINHNDTWKTMTKAIMGFAVIVVGVWLIHPSREEVSNHFGSPVTKAFAGEVATF